MLKKYAVLWMLCALATPGLYAQIQEIRDVLPNDKVTSLEFSPSLDVIDSSGSTSLSK